MTDDMTSKAPMRKDRPLPTCSRSRVSFLEGSQSDEQSSGHVEDKLVQSSGPSGRNDYTKFVDFLEAAENVPRRRPTSGLVSELLDYIRQECDGEPPYNGDPIDGEAMSRYPPPEVTNAHPPAEPDSHIDFTDRDSPVYRPPQNPAWQYNERGHRMTPEEQRLRRVHVDKNGKWYVINKSGARVYRDTVPEGQESPPTTPPDKGTHPPLQYQLGLNFYPLMEVDLGVFANTSKLYVDYAETEARVAAAFKMPPGAPAGLSGDRFEMSFTDANGEPAEWPEIAPEDQE